MKKNTEKNDMSLSDTPRVDTLIDKVIAKHPGTDRVAQANYFEDVHQHLAPLARELERENNELRADAARLNWLSDKNNQIGNVLLPAHCVTANLTSLRGAIDMAMGEQDAGN